jgi:peptidoglycan/LPS O-acetylase OafA/YrhL
MLRAALAGGQQFASNLAHLVRPSSLTLLRSTKDVNQQTGHLDGLRGLAAFIVFICHLAYSSHDVSIGYGFTGERQKETGNSYTQWLRLPIVRLFYDGDPAVTMFFLISGFALSWKPLKLAREKEWAGFARTLMGSTIKRWPRLFLPVLASTGIIFLMVQLGVYDLTRGIANDKKLLSVFQEPHPEAKSNVFEMVFAWLYANWTMWQPFHWNRDGVLPYDIHLWTIPVELRASMGLFVTLLAVGGMKSRVRVVTLAVLIVVACLKDSWAMMMFWAGALEAELTLSRQASSAIPVHDVDKHDGPGERFSPRNLARLSVLVVSLFLMSEPFEPQDTFGWRALVPYIPSNFSEKRRFYTCIGSMACFHLLTTSDHARAFFRSHVMQYLGRISYGLYLVHAFVLHTFGYAVFSFVWSITGVETVIAKEVGFVVAAAGITPFALYVADIFHRAVDEPSVRLAKWMENQVIFAG